LEELFHRYAQAGYLPRIPPRISLVTWPLFNLSHLQTVRVQYAVLSDVLCAYSPMHLAKSATLICQQSICYFHWTFEAEI